MKRLSLLLCLFSLPALAMGVGVNLNGIFDSDPSLMYADAMMTARNWGNTATPFDEAAAVDSNGWPTGDAGIYLFSVSGSAYPSTEGVYCLSWDSVANPTVTMSQDATHQTISGKSCSGGHCTATLTLAAGAIGESVPVFTGTSGGIRNLKVMRPISPGSATCHATSEYFSRLYLADVAPFDVFRTMDLTLTNNSNVTTWAQRTSPTWATHKGPKLNGQETGMPWEDACLLATATGKDLWINIPVQVDDTYISSLATNLKANCPTSTRICVEYGNENWNNQFAQPHEVYDRAQCSLANAWQASHAYTTRAEVSTVSAAQAMYAINDSGKCYVTTTSPGPGGGTSASSGGPTGTGTNIADGTAHWDYVFNPPDNPSGGATFLDSDGETNAFYMGNRFTSERTHQAEALFSAVYGSSAINTRIRFVIEGQGAGAPLLQSLTFAASKYSPLTSWLWGAGSAQYFAESGSTSGDSTATATRIIEEYKNQMPQLISDQKTITTAAHNYGLHVSMYEGGPASAGGTALAAKISANSDSRMQQIMWDWLGWQDDNGVDLVCQYQLLSAWTSSGLWGLCQDGTKCQDPTASPKWTSMAAWKTRRKTRPRFPTTTIIGKNAIWVDGTTFNSGNGIACNASGTKIRWKVHVPGSGAYKIVYTYNVGTASLATISVNGVSVFTGTLPDHSGTDVALPNVALVTLTAGDNVIEHTCGDANQVVIQSLAISDQ